MAKSSIKQPEPAKHVFVRQWLAKAEEDRRAAEYLLSSEAGFLGVAAFHCQQAVEKYLKAWLVFEEVDFRKTHDIAELLDCVAEQGAPWCSRLGDTIILSKYAVELRYPADIPELTREEAASALKMAKRVRRAIRKALPLAVWH